MVQQRTDIPATQQRSGLLVKLTLFQQEQHRHHDQRQVMVPAAPTPDLVVTQPNVLFTLPQGMFYPIALALHERQSGCRRVRHRVAQAILDLGRVVDLPADDQVPLPGLGFFPIPQPYALMQDIDPQRAFRAVAR